MLGDQARRIGHVTVVQLIKLMPHSTRDLGLIQTSGSVCAELARSPCDSKGFLWVFRFPPGAPVSSRIPDMWVCTLIGLCKLPLVCKEWMRVG